MPPRASSRQEPASHPCAALALTHWLASGGTGKCFGRLQGCNARPQDTWDRHLCSHRVGALGHPPRYSTPSCGSLLGTGRGTSGLRCCSGDRELLPQTRPAAASSCSLLPRTPAPNGPGCSAPPCRRGASRLPPWAGCGLSPGQTRPAMPLWTRTTGPSWSALARAQGVAGGPRQEVVRVQVPPRPRPSPGPCRCGWSAWMCTLWGRQRAS